MLVNNRILAVVVGLIIILGAGGVFLYSHNTNSQNNSVKTNVSPTPEKVAGSTETSLADLFSMGKTQQCTFSVKGTSGTTTGVTYLSSTGKIRGNFQIVSGNKTSDMHMIRVGDDNYIWGDALPTGIKMKLSLSDLSSNAQASQIVPMQKTKFNCIPWTQDDSVFTVPSDVKFTDVGNIMQKTPTGAVTQTQTQSGTSNPCSTITDPTTKAACENAMKKY